MTSETPFSQTPSETPHPSAPNAEEQDLPLKQAAAVGQPGDQRQVASVQEPQPIAASVALITAACCLVGLICYLATFSRSPSDTKLPFVLGVVTTLFCMLPPLWFCRNNPNVSLGALLPSLWRFGALIPAIVFLKTLIGEERNYYILTLLTCYFVSLPLESRALIRMARNQSG